MIPIYSKPCSFVGVSFESCVYILQLKLLVHLCLTSETETEQKHSCEDIQLKVTGRAILHVEASMTRIKTTG